MHRRRLFCRALLGLSLALSVAGVDARVASAQAEHRITDFVRTADGFQATLLFRNTQGVDGGLAVSFNGLTVGLSNRLRTVCQSEVACNIIQGTRQEFFEGAVDLRDLRAGNIEWTQVPNWQAETSCGVSCLSRFYGDAASLGTFGCLLPGSDLNPFSFFSRRTCAEDGFDGWIGKDLVFRGLERNSDFELTADDISVAFSGFREFTTGVAPQVIPEPSTYALMATGLAGLAWIRRRRGPASCSAGGQAR